MRPNAAAMPIPKSSQANDDWLAIVGGDAGGGDIGVVCRESLFSASPLTTRAFSASGVSFEPPAL